MSNNKMFGIALKALIIYNSKVLIVKRESEDDYKPDEYDLPGGRLEFGESPEEALKREVLEETGLEIEIVTPSRVWTLCKNNNKQIIGITFLTLTYSKNVKLSFEHQDYNWIDFEDATNINMPFWLKSEIESGLDLYQKSKMGKNEMN